MKKLRRDRINLSLISLALITGLVISTATFMIGTNFSEIPISSCDDAAKNSGAVGQHESNSYARGWPIAYIEVEYCSVAAEPVSHRLSMSKFIVNSSVYVVFIAATMSLMQKRGSM